MHSVSRGGVTYVRLNGTIDESFDPNLLLNEAKGQKVILNIKGVTRLSSFGVREWTNAIRELCNRVEHVYFVEVSPAVVTQLNMVANFAGSAHILSVQAPFYCDCGFETEITFDLREGTVNMGTVKCRECGSPMSFDDDVDAYFSYPLENARSKPMDPNIDVFLRHLSEGMSDEGSGMRSFPPPVATNEPSNAGVRSSSVSIPRPSDPRLTGSTTGSTPGTNISQVRSGGTGIGLLPPMGESTSMSVMEPRPAAAWVKAKSLLLGLSIPAVLAGVMLLLWPSGGSGSGLPDEVKDQYTEHFEKGRLGQAAVLIRKAKKDKKIDQEAASKLEGELRDAALKPYQEQLEKGNFAEAARVVTMASRERVIQPRDSNRLHKDVMERALAKYREMLAAENLREADALAEELATGDALPTALRRNFQNDVSFEKQQVAQKLERAAQDAFDAKKWDDALDAVKKIERLGPPKPDVVFMMAEAYRNVGKEEDAVNKYKEFIDNVTSAHDHFDDALFQRGMLLVKAGRKQDANDLFKRLVAEVPSSSLRPEAERQMR